MSVTVKRIKRLCLVRKFSHQNSQGEQAAIFLHDLNIRVKFDCKRQVRLDGFCYLYECLSAYWLKFNGMLLMCV